MLSHYLKGVFAKLQFGKSGGFIEWSASAFIAKIANGALSRLKLAAATETDDAVTFAQLNINGALRVVAEFDGASVPAVVEGKIIICNNTAGGFVIDNLYIGQDGTYILLSLITAQLVTFATDTSSISGTTYLKNNIYIWSGSAYTVHEIYVDLLTTRGDILIRNASDVTSRLALGTSGQVLQSDGVDINYKTLDKTDVGLENIDNTSDANKPVSTAMQTALDLKADKNLVIAYAIALG